MKHVNSDPNQGGTGRKRKRMTQAEAEQEVLAMADQGVRYREVSQVEFNIDGHIKHFSLAQISRIVNSRDNRAKPQSKSEGDLDSEMFKLFENGKGPTYAVIRLRISSKVADETYKRWMTMKEADLSQDNVPRRLKELERRFDSLDPIQEIADYLRAPYDKDDPEAPTFSDIYSLLSDAKDINSMPITNLGRSKCKHCGSKGLNAIKYQCTQCGTENWWGRWPKK